MPFDFDPKKRKEHLLSGAGYRRLLAEDVNEAKQLGSLCNFSGSMLTDGIYCWLVGLHREGQALFERAAEWLQASVNNNEDGVGAGGRAGIYEKLALGKWLLTGRNDDANLKHSVVYHEEEDLNRDLAVGKNPHTLSLDIYMAMCLQAGLCERGITMLKKSGEDVNALIPTKASSPRKVAAVLCRSQSIPSQFSKEAVAAGERLLRKHVPDWVGRGHAVYVATWLKILHWTPNPRLSPKEVILKAYDYLAPELRKQAGV